MVYELSVTKIVGLTETKPMSKTNVKANLMFALRTITRNEPMTKPHTFPDIGLIPVIVGRANKLMIAYLSCNLKNVDKPVEMIY